MYPPANLVQVMQRQMVFGVVPRVSVCLDLKAMVLFHAPRALSTRSKIRFQIPIVCLAVSMPRRMDKRLQDFVSAPVCILVIPKLHVLDARLEK